MFAAALEQGQQFMKAAEMVGYATRPVQLFTAFLSWAVRSLRLRLAWRTASTSIRKRDAAAMRIADWQRRGGCLGME
jgi:hypothetical protein